jgi:hypothetical protein
LVAPIAPLNVPVDVKNAFIPVNEAPVNAGAPAFGRKFGLVE